MLYAKIALKRCFQRIDSPIWHGNINFKFWKEVFRCSYIYIYTRLDKEFSDNNRSDFSLAEKQKQIMSEWSKNSWLVYSLSSIRLKRCHSTMVLFLTLCYLLKKNWKKQEENVLILRHMGKENDVLIWVKLSQVKNFMFYSSVYYHTSTRSPCTHNIEYIENWKKSIEGDMKKNLLLLLWFPEIFSLCLTLGL